MLRDSYAIVKHPVITEKATDVAADGAYTFEVARDANKIEIRKAIESIYRVKVTGVNTMRVKGKLRRMGRNVGRTPDWKKAIVTLADGHKIDLV